MQGQLTPGIMTVLQQWVATQRWYAGKGRTPVLTRIGGMRLEDPAGQGVAAVRPIRDDIKRRIEALLADILPE